jgi:hypothetical protein
MMKTFIGAFKGDVLLNANARAEGVDASHQWMDFTITLHFAAAKDATDDSSSEIDPLVIRIKAPRGVSVRSLHVAHRCAQNRRNGRVVGHRVCLA